MIELAKVLDIAHSRGYTKTFDAKRDGVEYTALVDTIYLDAGTDPGDDVTIYLLKTGSGALRYLLVSDSFHADPRTASMIDEIIEHSPSGRSS
jgi:hypothetical protein